MTILAIDTSGPSAGAAVMRGSEILSEIFLNCGLTHSQTIMLAAESALEQAGLTPKDVDLFACVVGPGSFTGVRIGTCAVRAMSHAAVRPCVAIDALEALAHGTYGFDGVICPILDARRDQVYGAAFRTGSTPVRILEDRALALSELMADLPDGENILFTGEAAPIHKDEICAAFGKRAFFAPSHMLHVRPAAAADLASRLGTEEYVTPEKLKPLYLRAPSAERERSARLSAEAKI